MKNIKLHITLFLTLLIFFGCDKPVPTQLVYDGDPLEVEIITKDTEDEFYSSGFDTTGIIYQPSGFANVVTVSGIKISTAGVTVRSELAQAVFFDRSMPVYSPDGRLLGFRTRLFGNVEFNGVPAFQRPFVLKFRNRNSGQHNDTLLGFRHVLYNGPNSQGENFNFEYGSSVNFNLTPFIGSAVNFNIPTPGEVTGSVRMEGNRFRNNLKAYLQWNGLNSEKFEIIISGKRGRLVFPLFRIRTRDDGELQIPARLLSQIPFERFDKLVFSLSRKIEIHHEGNSDLYILSQSIHSLVVNIH